MFPSGKSIAEAPYHEEIQTKKEENPKELLIATLGVNHPLVQIARCESNYVQFVGTQVLRGRVNPKDVGLLQINEFYHLEESKKLGIDIYTTEGNIAYGKYLYDHQGTQPWSASKPCWGEVTVDKT